LWRMIGRQVRSRRDRSIALGAGILVASVSFSLLTAAAATSQLEVHGTVDAASRPAYDILVRPKGAADAIETQDNLVRDNFLAGTYGGISIAQWQRILDLPNVTVAAPIANIGYVIPQATVVVPVNPVSSSDPQQLYRVNVTWKADNGLSSYPGGTDYVYYTPTGRFVWIPDQYGGSQVAEIVPGVAKPVAMCPPLGDSPAVGLNTGAEESLDCFSGSTSTVSRRLTRCRRPSSSDCHRPWPLATTSMRRRVWGHRSVTPTGSRSSPLRAPSSTNRSLPMYNNSPYRQG
jgi:hypothetical protein